VAAAGSTAAAEREPAERLSSWRRDVQDAAAVAGALAAGLLAPATDPAQRADII